jgi:hypothetical protein
MADTPDTAPETTDPASTKAPQTAEAAGTTTSAANQGPSGDVNQSASADQTSVDGEAGATPQSEAPAPDPEFVALLEKVKSNIQDTLDEEQLTKALSKRIKKIKNWEQLSESAKITCVHILTTQILYKNTDVEIEVDELSVAENEERDIFYEFVNSMSGRPYFRRKAFREEFVAQKLKNREHDAS